MVRQDVERAESSGIEGLARSGTVNAHAAVGSIALLANRLRPIFLSARTAGCVVAYVVRGKLKTMGLGYV